MNSLLLNQVMNLPSLISEGKVVNYSSCKSKFTKPVTSVRMRAPLLDIISKRDGVRRSTALPKIGHEQHIVIVDDEVAKIQREPRKARVGSLSIDLSLIKERN